MAGSGQERARHWRYPELPGVDLLRARFVEKIFVRHTHENFVIAAISDGVEVFHHGGADQYAGPGALALVNPDTPHTGRAGVPEGWRYGAVYPSPELVAEIAAETTTIRGTPGFVSPVLDDPYAAGLVHEVLRAAEEGNALAADTLLRVAVTRLLRLNGGPLPQRGVRTAGARVAARARAVLEERMAEPPTLERLAADLGTSPFALLRAFRETYGMPPHTWLTDARVRRARHLLDAGSAPAEAAVAVGFTDQPHLNRHFTRIVGVPPGAYQRERKNVQDVDGRPYLPSGVWQNRQLSQTYAVKKAAENPTRPSSGTPWESGSPSDCPVSPSE
ncbi:AraC family transcriptional regulator [Streptomyces mirabilis]|uniref:AraC family transcriptional regulator n=1 Tax=Streptomyces mirabilis TaxID=68239 RepID=A0ABU3UJH6_9ACTN|nr:AraC family transcriptional regulator [Streptomyces mirabilis]MDU8994028.1 AraC family transcriptional regulator [Streptomyces mirabilis]